ncbi:MAG: hypothetical protein ACLGH3_04575 [Actinomycetota bacterium]
MASGIAVAAISILALSVPIPSAAEVVREVDRFEAPMGTPDGWFGRAVALDGDSAFVSGTEFDTSGSPFGFVSGYRWNGERWVTGEVLRSTRPYDGFGMSLAMEDDLLAVGAPGYCDIGEDSTEGQVLLFRRTGSSWGLEATIRGPSCLWFGVSIDLAGQVLVVGSVFDHGGATGAFVYEFVEGVWAQTARIKPPAGSEEYFGSSVVTDGMSIVIGDPWRYDSKALIYQRQGGTWVGAAEVVGPPSASWTGFGSALSIDGGVLAVGSWNGDEDKGAAFLYDANDWQLLAELAVPDLQPGDRFGWSVSVDQASVVVGAPGRRVDGSGSAGSAYLFEPVEGSWASSLSFAAGEPEEGDQLAAAVAMSGGRLLAGAMSDDTACGRDAGAAYLFEVAGDRHAPARAVECGTPPARRGPDSTVNPGIASRLPSVGMPLTGNSTGYAAPVAAVEVWLEFVSGGMRGIYEAAVSCSGLQCTWALEPPPNGAIPAGIYEVRARGLDEWGNIGPWSRSALVSVVG